MLLGVDFGTAKVGLAVSSDDADAIPAPLMNIRYTKLSVLKEGLVKIIDEYNVDTIVVGVLPEKNAGDEEKRTKYEEFLRMINELNVSIAAVDETRSTKAALSLGKENPDFKTKNDDAIAAQVLLETYLNSRGGSHGAGDQR